MMLTMSMYTKFPQHTSSRYHPPTLPELLPSDLHLRFRLETPLALYLFKLLMYNCFLFRISEHRTFPQPSS